MSIANPNYKNPQNQPEYKPISEQELKKKILEKEFEQKCEWELRKLGMGEQTNKVQNNNITSGGGLISMNFNEFDYFGSPKE